MARFVRRFGWFKTPSPLGTEESMKSNFCGWRGALLGLLMPIAVGLPLAHVRGEETFDVLQIGTQVYKNVTVTTKAKSYVFIHHSNGITNIKLAELPADVQVKLGYPDPTAPKVQTNAAAVWAKNTLQKLPVQQIKAVEQQMTSKLSAREWQQRLPFPVPPVTRNLIIAVAAILLGLYLFHCYCCKLICKKAGTEPGVLVWIPVLQLLPMLQAARMSRWWFLAYFCPVLNIVAQVLWSFKIADARNKSAVIGVFLLLPVLSLFAFLFLAFSDNLPNSGGQGRRHSVEIMTLEAA